MTSDPYAINRQLLLQLAQLRRDLDLAHGRIRSQDRVLPSREEIERVERASLDMLKRRGTPEQVAEFAHVWGELLRAAMQVGRMREGRREP